MSRIENARAAASKARKKISVPRITEAAWIEELAEMVREVHATHRERGLKNEECLERAGEDLGMQPRRVQMFRDREVYSLEMREAEAIRNGHVHALQQLARWHAHRFTVLARRLAVIDRKDFGDDAFLVAMGALKQRP